MLRIHFIQHWFNLADPCGRSASTVPACAASWALIWVASRCPTPPPCSSSAACSITKQARRSPVCRSGEHSCRPEASRSTLAPSWTPPSLARPARPRTRTRPDPEMHQTRKGQQWYFGMKLHIGGQPKRAGAQRRGDSRQRARQTPAARTSAWSRAARVRRLGLCQPENVDPGQAPKAQDSRTPNAPPRRRWSMRQCARTATNPASARGWNTCSGGQAGCGLWQGRRYRGS